MHRENTVAPVISVDFKKGRIRIHGCTMQGLQNPVYFILLVNPDERILAIKACSDSTGRAYRNRAKQEGQSFEVYSHSLLRQLRICGHWEENKAYKLSGQLLLQEQTILFHMNEAVEIIGSGGG